MGRDDSVELYTDRFYKLRREADCEDNRVIAAFSLVSDKRATIDHAANLTRRMYGNVVHSKYSKQVAVGSDSFSSSSAVSAAAAGPSFAVSGKKNKGKKRADAKHCRLHGTGRHSSEECRALSSLQTGGNAGKVVKFSGSLPGARAAGSCGGSSSSGKKNCFVPWKQGHVREVNHLAIRSASLHQ
ncbi:hypothetical protein INT45_008166 [Circinella minor]|uniref:Uncharacterized protein n=1 Tax=Circinella minor TaxID=1195481 RepID=A0A8H7RXN2_9FUNG|nr:hypothetical protein INT45_008166 [Circinella minor]